MRCHAPGTAPAVQAKADTVRRWNPAPPTNQRQEPGTPGPAAQSAFGSAGWSFADVPIHRPGPVTGLPEPLRAGVERLSGLAMDDVRVHRDSLEPARLGALAFTKGSDIHLGPGQEQHLPHEAWHVVQQKQGRAKPVAQAKHGPVCLHVGLELEADVMGNRAAGDRDTTAVGTLAKRDAPIPEIVQAKPDPLMAQRQIQDDSRTMLGTTLRGPAFSKGFKLVFYEIDHKTHETDKRAAAYAKRELAIGFSGEQPTASTIVVGRAIHADKGIKEVTVAIADIVADALTAVPAPVGTPTDEAEAPGKIETLAIFSHGWPTGTGTELTAANEGEIIGGLASKLASNVKVILFACGTGRSWEEEESWYTGVMKPGGEESLASQVRDVLAESGVEEGVVWAHTVSAHTSENPAKRYFEVSEGKGAAGKSYLTQYVLTVTEEEAATKDVSVVISELGYVTESREPDLQKHVAKLLTERGLESHFYKAYIEAWKNLGKGIAEEAPNYPERTAQAIKTYWLEVYWPKHRRQVALSTIKALKLKKGTPVNGK